MAAAATIAVVTQIIPAAAGGGKGAATIAVVEKASETAITIIAAVGIRRLEVAVAVRLLLYHPPLALAAVVWSNCMYTYRTV